MLEEDSCTECKRKLIIPTVFLCVLKDIKLNGSFQTNSKRSIKDLTNNIVFIIYYYLKRTLEIATLVM